MKDHAYFVYLEASGKNGTLYTGMTNNIAVRSRAHADGEGSKFTSRYGVDRLVWYEQHRYVENAIAREKAIKKWRRAWKIKLIEESNPDWNDLGPEMW